MRKTINILALFSAFADLRCGTLADFVYWLGHMEQILISRRRTDSARPLKKLRGVLSAYKERLRYRDSDWMQRRYTFHLSSNDTCLKNANREVIRRTKMRPTSSNMMNHSFKQAAVVLHRLRPESLSLDQSKLTSRIRIKCIPN